MPSMITFWMDDNESTAETTGLVAYSVTVQLATIVVQLAILMVAVIL
jgi:hypothetical protein